ncbi:hypothetical protein HDU92_008096 [Lobulomyces angularis]|nr:hypothetical protein HDU92_008096 [Lobulomyces angularis]
MEKEEDNWKDGFEDKFLPNETDPEKTNAIESSLWELQTLKNHYLPSISTLSKIFEESLNRSKYDLEDFLDINYNSLFKEDYGQLNTTNFENSSPLILFDNFDEYF